MWIADNWKDYEVIDCSKGEKLERWGDYILVRPDPQVIWTLQRQTKDGNPETDTITEAKKAAVNGNFSVSRSSGRFITDLSPLI